MKTLIEVERDKIDNIDKNICNLLNERFEIVKRIGKIKKLQKLEVINTGREQFILENVEKNSTHPKQSQEIFKKIIEVSRSLQ